VKSIYNRLSRIIKFFVTDKYNSLFLTNYRESKKIARKRISFDLAYKIVGMLLKKHMNK
jgi:hypothetical protein